MFTKNLCPESSHGGYYEHTSLLLPSGNGKVNAVLILLVEQPWSILIREINTAEKRGRVLFSRKLVAPESIKRLGNCHGTSSSVLLDADVKRDLVCLVRKRTVLVWRLSSGEFLRQLDQTGHWEFRRAVARAGVVLSSAEARFTAHESRVTDLLQPGKVDASLRHGSFPRRCSDRVQGVRPLVVCVELWSFGNRLMTLWDLARCRLLHRWEDDKLPEASSCEVLTPRFVCSLDGRKRWSPDDKQEPRLQIVHLETKRVRCIDVRWLLCAV